MLDEPITVIKGVGPEATKLFSKVGVTSIGDLCSYYPRRYEDYSVITEIRAIRPGAVTIRARIQNVTGRYVRRGMHITEAVASDATDSVRLVWFNQTYRAQSIKRDSDYLISGLFELSNRRLSIMNPTIEPESDFPINTARIVPVYKETKGLTSKQIRKVVAQIIPVIEKLPETLPQEVVLENDLLSYANAVKLMHYPSSTQDVVAAKRRLGFEEIFGLSLAGLLNKQAVAREESVKIPFNKELAQTFVSQLPFTLTDEQRKVIWQIYQDMQRGEPMNRLVEGDVGSGKTVVAAMAALMAIKQNYQVVLMAPTELLARQHAETLHKLLKPLRYERHVGLLVGGLDSVAKAEMQTRIASGDVKCIIGTHAVIQQKVDMHNLALIIIDEQHRFGVEQRKTLMKKAGHMPHVLHLTATPIPRSLALTLYGELDISIIAHKPANRKSIKTVICSPNSREQLYESIIQELEAGRQMFVVCPLIEESASLKAVSADEAFTALGKSSLKKWRIGLLHGKMKPSEKQTIMEQFVRHELDILVSTTVIEVGVDVPNATVMLIESAERFGLAQIHQLRGRVGRSDYQGYCYLMMSDSKAPSKRLRALEASSDGFKLAELDLELRGPGAIYGTSQHGQLDLRVAQLTDTKLIMAARKSAEEFIKSGKKLVEYPELAGHVAIFRTVTNLN